jgi:hypothetical protein
MLSIVETTVCVTDDGAAVVPLSAPWTNKSLVSLLDMLQFAAREFFWCGGALRVVKFDCYAGAATAVDGKTVYAMAKDLDEAAKNKAIPLLTRMESEFRKIQMVITADTVLDLINDLNSAHRHSFDWLNTQSENIERLAHREMKGKVFMYLDPERTKYWPNINLPHVFGDSVGTAFPSINYDAYESGVCLALARGSASVFHLMRILEIGLSALGATFGVSLAHTNWAPAIEQIESKIRDMHKDPTWKALPDCKEQQEFFSQAASHFGILKDAWRNYTMHVRGKYTPDEAEKIFINVRSFMQKLAERVKEPS